MSPHPHKHNRWPFAKTLSALFLVAAGTGCAPDKPEPKLPYSEFIEHVEKDKVQAVRIDGQHLTVTAQSFRKPEPPKKPGFNRTTNVNSLSALTTYLPANEDVSYLRDKKIKIDTVPPEEPMHPLLPLGGLVLGMVLLSAWLRKRAASGQGGIGGITKSKAKIVKAEDSEIRFTDVAGIDEARQELEEIVSFLKHPAKYRALGARIPKGILLSGPPGTGKTLTVKALAGEAGVPFFQTSGSDFVEMFVGVGAGRVRNLFAQAKKQAPCIIFIDEIDAVGGQRGSGTGGGNDEREQTLNQLLTEMDGFEEKNNVIVIAATNRPDMLDKALTRPGRFDRKVTVSRPDLNGREAILKVHVKKVPLGEDVNLRTIARGVPGFTGAALRNLVNEAALTAARRNDNKVMAGDFDDAKDRIIMGAARKNLLMPAEDMDNTAYHEAGHAIVSLFSPGLDPIHKATIIPHDLALGMVVSLPTRDQYSTTREKMKSLLAMAAAGRVAEELYHNDPGKVTSGAVNDIKMMTRYANAMVKEYSLSNNKEMGMHAYAVSQEDVMQGIPRAEGRDVQRITDEVNALLKEAVGSARKILTEHEAEWRAVAKALRQHETLTGDEIKAIVAECPLRRSPLSAPKPL